MKRAIEIIKKLQDNGFCALTVGGCVRDVLLKVKPKDIDVVTSATPDEVKSLFKKAKLVGETFGVIIVEDYEIATLREDSYDENGNVSVGIINREGKTLEEMIKLDAHRRDLSFNSIYYDPIADKYYDPVGGIEDLKNRKIRFVGSMTKRVEEHPIRLLRAIRFGVKYNISFPSAVNSEYHRELLTQEPKEQIFKEFTKILMNLNTWDIAMFRDALYCASYVIPELFMYETVEQSPVHHPEGALDIHTFHTIKNLRVKNPVTVWAALLHDCGKLEDTYTDEEGNIRCPGHASTGKEMTIRILTELKCSNKFIEEVSYIVGEHMRIKEAGKIRKSKVILMKTHKYFDNLKEVSCADSMASTGKIDWYHFLNDFKVPQKSSIKPLITGVDLIQRGEEPGPAFRQILEDVYHKQLDEGIEDKTVLVAVLEALLD